MEFDKLVAALAAQDEGFAEAFDSERAMLGMCDTVRRQLVEMRKAAGLRQEEIAERLGMSQSAVSRMERGTGDIGLTTIARYAAAIGVRPVIVFAPTDSGHLTSPETRLVMNAALRLSDRAGQANVDRAARLYSGAAQRQISDLMEIAIVQAEATAEVALEHD